MIIKKTDLNFLLHTYQKMKKDPLAKKKFASFSLWCENYLIKEKRLYKKLSDKPRMNCCDCLNFKLKKNWQQAYCKEGWMNYSDIKETDKPRMFNYETTEGILGNRENFIDRSLSMSILNKESCPFYIGMEDENDVIFKSEKCEVKISLCQKADSQ